ncbi:MAG: hypothetical protein M3137_20095 [Actinomycetota bacterium]|nr:hypothetical protein [Actinomycetota bacterium]
MHTYLRDIRREQLSVVIRRPGYGMWVPPGGFPRSGSTAYEVSYTAHSRRE